jgi:hypothetical protein
MMGRLCSMYIPGSKLAFVCAVSAVAVVVGAGAAHEQPARAAGTVAVVLGAQVPDVTGKWNPPTGCPWHLTASGPGHDMLHMTWSGSCAAGGHTALNGVFNGSLSGTTYTGNFQVVEGSVHVTGTMSCEVVSATKIVVTLHPIGGNASTVILTHHASLSKGGPNGPLLIDVAYFGSTLVTAPRISRGCTAPTSLGQGSGSFQGHRSATDGHISGGGSFSIHKPLTKACHGPGMTFSVTGIAVTVAPAAHVSRAVLAVTINGSANVQPGQCRSGMTGTITLTENDSVIAANSYPTDTVKFGPWSAPGCNAFSQLITNNISPITATAKGSTWDKVFIGCLHMDGTGGFSPRNCLEG